MKYQVARVSVLQTSKVMAILYALFGLLVVPFGCFYLTLGSDDPTNYVFAAVYILAPILYGVFGFIFMAIWIWVYNLLASRIGGVELELEDVPEAN